MAVIDIKNLSYIYGPGTPYEKKALEDISFSVEKGELLGIVGSNGSGKSTLIQHFNGLLSPTSGSISVLGFDARDKKYRDQLWQKVGLVFQFPEQQLFEASVFAELAYGLKNMGLKHDEIEYRVQEALESVGLAAKQVLDSSPLCLSGGMRRRAAVACILAMKPEILVMDEPTAGLDPEGCAQIWGTIKKIHKEQGTTVIMVSHYINELVLLADRIMVLENGVMEAWGPPRKVLGGEDMLNIDVLLPDYLKLLYELKKKGAKINTGMLTLEEAAGEIARILRRSE